jgi:hypothetical protein
VSSLGTGLVFGPVAGRFVEAWDRIEQPDQAEPFPRPEL